MDKIALVEPSWGIDILNWGVDIQTKYEWISNLAPIFADIFVIAYPIFLVSIYIYAIIRKKPQTKQWALYIFFVTLFWVLINICIQSFLYKERPLEILSQINAWETLLHEILPVSSFPSDHAVVSMTFAVATLLRWIYNRKKFFTWSGVFFIFVSIIMTVCRILTLVHWPSDILAGLWLWILISLLFMIRPFRYMILRIFINPLIRVEQWIMRKIFNYEQGKI